MSKTTKFSSPEIERRKPRILHKESKKSKAGEIAGGTAAICCCCPCTVMHVLFLTVYKLPLSVCKKVKRRRLEKKKKKKKQKALSNESGTTTSRIDQLTTPRAVDVEAEKGIVGIPKTEEEEREVVELEKEMWERFNGGGFWRSRSQRSDKGRSFRTVELN